MANLETQKKIEELKKTLAELEQSLLVPKKTKEELMEEEFLSLINNSKYKIEVEANIWSNNNGEWLIKQNKKTKYIWFNDEQIWSIFVHKFNINIQVIKDFLSTMVVKHLDLHGYIPNYRAYS
jgi:hypothetical protein